MAIANKSGDVQLDKRAVGVGQEEEVLPRGIVSSSGPSAAELASTRSLGRLLFLGGLLDQRLFVVKLFNRPSQH